MRRLVLALGLLAAAGCASDRPHSAPVHQDHCSKEYPYGQVMEKMCVNEYGGEYFVERPMPSIVRLLPAGVVPPAARPVTAVEPPSSVPEWNYQGIITLDLTTTTVKR